MTSLMCPKYDNVNATEVVMLAFLILIFFIVYSFILSRLFFNK